MKYEYDDRPVPDVLPWLALLSDTVDVHHGFYWSFRTYRIKKLKMVVDDNLYYERDNTTCEERFFVDSACATFNEHDLQNYLIGKLKEASS